MTELFGFFFNPIKVNMSERHNLTTKYPYFKGQIINTEIK